VHGFGPVNADNRLEVSVASVDEEEPLFMHRKTYSALLTKLRHIETNPESRKYKSKRLTEHR
jgi:hypothetical protein